MEKKVEFKSIKDRIKFFSGQNNSNKPNVDNKNPAQTKSNKPKVENKNTDNTNSNKPKTGNNSINNTIPKNVKIDNKNIPKIEKTKIIGNYENRINIDDEDEEEKPHIIIDTGTCLCKAGLSGEEGPRTIFPSMVGYPKYASDIDIESGVEKDFFVGKDAEAKRGVLRLNFPIEKGLINNSDYYKKILGYIFTNELRVAPEEHNIMIIESPNNPKQNREKIAEIMFETFNVPGLCFENSANLSLYSIGKFYGIVIDSGGDLTHFVPIYDGTVISYAYINENLGGRTLNLYMEELLDEIGMRFPTSSEKRFVESIKEKACYAALDFEKELKCVEPYDYEFPDGTHVIIKDQRIRCPEVLFKPDIIGKDGVGIAQACINSIQKCDLDKRKDLYNNIVLSGGNSMFNGLPERLTKEIKYLAPGSMIEEVRVIASPKREIAAWIGGNILSSIPTFENSCITKTEYEEEGANIIHKKFP